MFKIKRVVVSTYQSVSGGGKAPMDELIEQTKSVLDNKKVKSKNFTKQIAFNVIPQCDIFLENNFDSYMKAVSTDPISFFGGIVAFNNEVDEHVADEMNKSFLECKFPYFQSSVNVAIVAALVSLVAIVVALSRHINT